MMTLSPHCGTEKVTILIYRRNSNVSPVPKPILKSFSFANILFFLKIHDMRKKIVVEYDIGSENV